MIRKPSITNKLILASSVLLFSFNTFSQSLTIVSMGLDGGQANFGSARPSISADGRYIAFVSVASNLVTGDDNNANDVFVYDTVNKETKRVSLTSSGNQVNAASEYPKISANGRYISFNSRSWNLAGVDNNNANDVFVHDMVTQETKRVSVNIAGIPANDNSSISSISVDGQYIAFSSAATDLVYADTNEETDIFVRDMANGTTERVTINNNGSEANDYSSEANISANGRYVVFSSYADNLVANDNNGKVDIFIYDRTIKEISLVSVSSVGEQATNQSSAPNITADGRYVVYSSYAGNLVSDDSNGMMDIFVYDTINKETKRASINSNGIQGNGHSKQPTISDDGRFVGFLSFASNLVDNDNNGVDDVFIHDFLTGKTIRANTTYAVTNREANEFSFSLDLSADGKLITFDSLATNLVANDDNNASDIFLRHVALNKISGLWYDTRLAGLGFNFIEADNGLFPYYYGYNSAGNPLWLVPAEAGSANIVVGETYTINMNEPTANNGANFNTKPDTPISGTNNWGTLSIIFHDETNATIILSGNDGNQRFSLTKLANNVEGVSQSGALKTTSGLWYDKSLAGLGFNFIDADNGSFPYYYGYDISGNPLWLVPAEAGPTAYQIGETYQIKMNEPTDDNGADFNTKPSTSASGTNEWGVIEVTFDSCNSGTATLIGIDGEQTFNLSKLATNIGASCE